MEEKNHIYPIFDRMMTRQDKEELLGQHSVMIWFTGLSGSGRARLPSHWNVSFISVDCFVVSWMGIISVVELIITWDSLKRTGWKISVA